MRVLAGRHVKVPREILKDGRENWKLAVAKCKCLRFGIIKRRRLV